MRWGVYALDGFEGAVAFRDGLLKIGEEVSLRSIGDFGADCVESFDVAVIFGLQGKGPFVKSSYAAIGVPVVVVDYGYLKRTNHVHDWRTGHWQVSVGGLNVLPVAPDASRWQALSLPVQERGGNPDGYTLLCMQTRGDASHGMDEAALREWARAQAEIWPGLWIRPHPLEADLDYGLPVCPAPNLQLALSGARLVVTANSNAGTDAFLAGVPSVATRPGAAWSELSGEHLPSMEARLAYFHRCAWGQWTWAEFRAGLAQRFLLETQL